MKFVLTKEGKATVASYIRELAAKRKEILDAREDTAEDTVLPTEEDILEDICTSDIEWDDPDGPCGASRTITRRMKLLHSGSGRISRPCPDRSRV